MTLQQLKYVYEAAGYKSIREAAKNLYISQPALSTLIQDLEEELEISIFERTGRGISLTADGRRLLEHASKMIECEKEIQSEFHPQKGTSDFMFYISSQHFIFSIWAFMKTIQYLSEDRYHVRLHETTTINVLRDVAARKSELGFLSLNHSAKKQLSQFIRAQGLEFCSLYTGKPFVFMWHSHPLAGRKSLTMEDLKPYPYIQYDQEDEPLHLFSEEPIIENHRPSKVIVVSDLLATRRAWQELNAYDLGTGLLFPNCDDGVVTLPLEEDVKYDLGYVIVQNTPLSRAAVYMLKQIKECLSDLQSF